MTETRSYVNINPCTTVLSADQQPKEDIVNEYIRKIEVFASDKSSGKRKQKIKIYWNFVDELDLEIFSQPIVYERITKQTQNMQKTA